jgi:hypothetical protein
MNDPCHWSRGWQWHNATGEVAALGNSRKSVTRIIMRWRRIGNSIIGNAWILDAPSRGAMHAIGAPLSRLIRQTHHKAAFP